MKKYKFDVSNVESFVNDVRLNFTSDDLEEIQKVGKELNHCLNSMGQVGEVTVVKTSDENPIGKTIVIMNETHGLMDEQKSILDRKYSNYEILSVPANGWTLREMQEIGRGLVGNTVVFVSPIPYLIKMLSYNMGYSHYDNCQAREAWLTGWNTKVFVFHNDNREKKELPNGKIIQVVAKSGWQLV